MDPASDDEQCREFERRLHQLEDNIYGLFDNTKANILLIDPKTGSVVYANKAACEFYGYTRDQILKMRISDIDTTVDRRETEICYRAGEMGECFCEHRLANAEVREVEVFSGPIELKGVPLLFIIVYDVSAIERSKRLAEEVEVRYYNILNSLAVGIAVAKPSGEITYVNNTLLELLKKGPEELIGHNALDFISDDEKKMARENLQSRTKGIAGDTTYRLERGDGSDIYALVRTVPIIRNDVYEGVIVSVTDISETRRDADRVKESEKKFRDIFNNIRDAVMIHRPGGQFLEVNDVACERYGYSREELLHMRPEDLDTPETASEVLENTRLVMENNSATFESMQITKKGRRIPAEIGAILTSYRGEPAIMVSCRDITKRKMAEEGLARANEKLKILNGITRHDIMNQLTVLKGNLGLVMSKVNDAAVNERLKKIDRSAFIIEYQIEFAKDYQEMGTVSPQWQSIGEVVSKLPDIKDIAELTMDEELDRLNVYADPMLGKVFHNIIEDSVKYAAKPLQVKIGYEMNGCSLVIIYEDEGPGIPIEDKENIFAMGFGKGTGLGLYLSKEILLITGIKIRENGIPGKGVRFEMEVPEGAYRFDH
jgi:PAS domain S-box-containing protein